MSWTIVVLWLLFILLPLAMTTMLGDTRAEQSLHRRAIKLSDLCPRDCQCNVTVRTVSCNAYYKAFSFRVFTAWTVWKLRQLTLTGGLSHISVETLPDLEKLVLRRNNISSLQSNIFSGVPNLKILDLSFNQIEKVEEVSFSGLTQLKVLYLNGNALSDLKSSIFKDLEHLEELYLDHNTLSFLPVDIFHPLDSLKILSLSYNNINHIYGQQLNNLTLLQVLNLDNNLLSEVSQDVMTDIVKAGDITVSISGNPFNCTCTIEALLQAVQSNPVMFKNSSGITCTDSEMVEKRLSSVRLDDLQCSLPNISYVTPKQDILYLTAVRLTCQTTGDPAPVVIWHTPWNRTFAHRSVQYKAAERFPGEHLVDFQYYHDTRLVLMTEVKATPDGSLVIDMFRGYFSGNFTCIAVSALGSANSTVHVGIHSMIPHTVDFTHFFAAGCVVAMLLIAAVVFVARTCNEKVCTCWKPKSHDEEVKKEEEEEDRVSEVVSEDTEGSPWLDSDDDNSPYPDTPPCSLYMPSSNNESPQKCTTPTGDPADKWISGTIIETLDEVKWRLRYGVERRMEKVRSQVQTMRETSSVYLQNIKESSSEAATKMKQGVVLRVEQVKYGVQSMKEFCGTSHMGGQTISMISVSTDVDTQEKSSVTKSVTYV